MSTPSTKTPGWNQRFFASTRGRIITLLRRTSRTVNELAEALDLTDNAVRAHLSTLERDGLVQPSGVRRSFRKPQQAYDLTPEAEQFFPKAYGLVFDQFLDVVGERLTPDVQNEVFREVGRRLAAGYVRAVQEQPPEGRRAMALQALADLGGLAEIKQEGDKLVIRGPSCPLAGLVATHPEACRLAEALLTEIVGAPVQEQCLRGASPQCCFEIATPERNAASEP